MKRGVAGMVDVKVVGFGVEVVDKHATVAVRGADFELGTELRAFGVPVAGHDGPAQRATGPIGDQGLDARRRPKADRQRRVAFIARPHIDTGDMLGITFRLHQDGLVALDKITNAEFAVLGRPCRQPIAHN